MSWRTLLAVAAGALLLAAPLAAKQATVPTGNLVVNPGAEDSPGAPVPTVVRPVGWTTTGNLSAWTYADRESDRPTQAFSATIGGGTNFFAGGPGDNSGRQTTHTASQTVDVSGAATEIDAGQVGATLTAFIGGYGADEDLATVTARFLDAAGTEVGSVRVGPVTSNDRKRLTVLLKRTAQTNVPVNTQKHRRRDHGHGQRQRRAPRLHRQHLIHAGQGHRRGTAGRRETHARRHLQSQDADRDGSSGNWLEGELGDVPHRWQGGRNRQEGAVRDTSRNRRSSGATQGLGPRESRRQDHQPDQVHRSLLSGQEALDDFTTTPTHVRGDDDRRSRMRPGSARRGCDGGTLWGVGHASLVWHVQRPELDTLRSDGAARHPEGNGVEGDREGCSLFIRPQGGEAHGQDTVQG